MARGQAHSDETKAAVMAALLAGQGVNEVATRYKLDPSVVSRWKKKIPNEKLQQVATQKEIDFEGRILEYLDANFIALKAQAQVAADPSYLRAFPPQQLAVLHGVMADKGVRLLEAMSAATESASQEAESEGSVDDTAGPEAATG